MSYAATAFPHNIRFLRAVKGITQGELAKQAGISEKSVHLYEAGAVEPSLGTAGKIAEVLGVTPNDLMDVGYVEDKRKLLA